MSIISFHMAGTTEYNKNNTILYPTAENLAIGLTHWQTLMQMMISKYITWLEKFV